MSDPAMTGGDSGHSSDEKTSIFDELDAEAAEEQHLDERHATGEHFTGGRDDDSDLGSI